MHAFTRDKMSAMDALAVIGGVNDARADPKGLLILREYPASAVKPGGPSNSRVVFTVDLTNIDGIFSARNFQINPNDLVMATEAPINDVLTVSSIIGRFLGLANTANNF
jgi:polysaccharide export outer membrane protein